MDFTPLDRVQHSRFVEAMTDLHNGIICRDTLLHVLAQYYPHVLLDAVSQMEAESNLKSLFVVSDPEQHLLKELRKRFSAIELADRSNKIRLIKAAREIDNLSLLDAKRFVEKHFNL